MVFCVDMGQQLKASFPVGLGVCYGVMVWKAAFPPFHTPRGVFCVRLQVGSGAVPGHQAVFFTLSALDTPSLTGGARHGSSALCGPPLM